MHYFTLDLMKEAGGNFVRWGHCAGSPADITAADQLGLLVLQPGVDGEGDAQGEAWTLRAAAFRDLLVYYRNHPSIIIWEGGNQKVTREHARELRQYADTIDPHGGRAFAHRRADEITGEFMDVDIGTEGGRQVPRLPVVEGEYDREESPRRVWDDFSPPHFGYPEAKGQTYQLTSEQYAVNQVTQYIEKLGAANHCGGANWIFSDSTSGGRVACEVARASGEVDGARLPKEAWYVCRTMFRNDPQAHIVGHWNYPAGTRKAIYVSSNCQQVELFQDGKSLGRGERSDRYLFTFPPVTWAPGELRAVGYREGKAAAVDTRKTVGPAYGLRLTPRQGPKGWQADGSDVVLVDVEVVDAQGDRCPTFEEAVAFDLAGPAVWRGGYNSGKTNSINQTSLNVECGINRVALRATRTAGPVTLSARCGNLKPASLTLHSRPTLAESGAVAALPALPAQAALSRSARQVEEPEALPDLAGPSGRFIKTFSYSGPTTTVRVAKGARDGSRAYVDKDYVFADMPDPLKGCDWVQAACADNLYSSVDLMELAPVEDGVVFIAHDDRLARPEWLVRQFKPTEWRLAIHGRKMSLFTRELKKGESLTLGSNAEDRSMSGCNMYIVFVKGPAPRLSQR
jgi:beta-galactosidase